MHFNEFLKQSTREIDSAIEIFFSTWSKEITHISPRLVPLISALHTACAGGKRIRGSLVLLGYALAAGNVTSQKKEVLKIAVAYELFQTAILAHDDIIDKSPTRRGKPSLHNHLGGDHYGMSQAICLGDLSFFMTYRLVSESQFADTIKNKLTTYLSNSFLDTVAGEILDVAKGDVLTIYRLKTAYYTFVAPLTVGAMLGGATADVMTAIRVYGENLGIAFQIRDDIRDVFGNEASMKKEIGGDIREGKNTLLFMKAMQNANAKQKKILEEWYGNDAIGQKELASIREVFRETGALDFAEQLSKDYCRKAQQAVSDITSDAKIRQLLQELIKYINP
jgi:geranylgeranyl diphosphate synthase type I